mgnify:CR=1 FL=1
MMGLKCWFQYYMSARRDPGTLRSASKDDTYYDFEELLTKFEPQDLCPECKLIRTPRSRHCAICNVCVERYDHHCTWINNCVGLRNHAVYLFFLFYVWVLTVLIPCIGMDTLGRNMHYDDSPLWFFCIGICHSRPLWMFVDLVDLFVATAFFFPATILFYIHCKNFCLGRTTHERFSKASQRIENYDQLIEEDYADYESEQVERIKS